MSYNCVTMDTDASKTVLNQAQLSVLEEALAHYGIVVTYDQLASFVPIDDPISKRRFVSRLAHLGWLVRIKKGVYQIADLSTLGTLTLSRYAVAHILAPASYVSFEAALQYHGLHDQMMRSLTSVGLSQHGDVELGGLTYRFVKTKTRFFFGFEEQTLDGQAAKIATAEKALIDLVQFHRTAYSVDKVAEVLMESRHLLDLARLNRFLEQTNLTTQRIFGLLFDMAGIRYDEQLLRRAQRGQASSYVTSDNTVYNAKWSLYYDPSLLQRYSIATGTP
jgi:predicted transcriptional regulator of viral defense system